MTYEELVEQLQEAIVLSREVERRLGHCQYGSDRGRTLALLSVQTDKRIDQLRRLIRNHPDSPPAG